ncbi:alpha/beta fold hydrolase [Pseudonocardia sp. ICBG1293]|uniref:alpha/beta fold hydrolase n=1 Tax=Pseudonocardia sp. ICBG1293 TaxID=2844382 RepID=UPI001CCE13BC|nr:alpha/beta hydrolase [Pseudonocardia sp. ICBG1293]
MSGPTAPGTGVAGPARVVLVHGAWHRGVSWAPVREVLAARGVEAVAPDLPSDVAGVGHAELVAAVLAATRHDPEGIPARPGTATTGTGDRDGGPPVVLVGHSLGGLVAAAAAGRIAERVRALVLVGALVPEPGRPYRDRLRAERDLMVPGYDAGVRRGEGVATYWPDVRTVADGLYRGAAEELAAQGRDGRGAVAAAAAELRPQDWSLLVEPCPLSSWPAVPTVSVLCTGDRVVDPVAGRREADRVGARPVELAGGHFPMLTRPGETADLLAGLAAPA